MYQSTKALNLAALHLRLNIACHTGLHVGECMVTTSSPQGAQVSLGVTLVLATQRIWEGDVFQKALFDQFLQ